MGAQAKTAEKAEQDLAKLNESLEFQLAQTAVDIAGIADPTPISDVIGAGMSLYSGDFIGAGLSLISIIPYAGDALGKTAKGARAAKKINDLKKRITAAIASVNAFKKAKASGVAAIRARRKANAAKRAAEAKNLDVCETVSEVFGTRLPKTKGKWSNPKNPGNSDWIPDPTTDRGKAILEATGGKPIKFKDGYPDFEPFAKKKVEIDMTGDPSDFTKANQAAGYKTTPEGMTWHHSEDGKTMLLVPSDINNKVPHTGGNSLVKELQKDPGY